MGEISDFGSQPRSNFVCFDARGNGSGRVAPTLTGDHQNRITDYTAVVVYESIQESKKSSKQE